MTPEEELQDLLARLVGVLDADLVMENPEIAAMVGQLVQILDPKSHPLPLDLIEKLAAIDNRLERFKSAAAMVEANDPEKLKQLADSLKEAGLLKSDSADLKRAEKADLVTLPSKIEGTNCGNCKFVDLEKSYCKHPEVDQALKDGPERMCCAFWDADGVKREWKAD